MSMSSMPSSNLAGYPTFTSGSKVSIHSYGKRSVEEALKREKGRIIRMTTGDEQQQEKMYEKSKGITRRRRKRQSTSWMRGRVEKRGVQGNSQYFYSPTHPSSSPYSSHLSPNQTQSSSGNFSQSQALLLSSSTADLEPLKEVEERVFIEILDKRKSSDDEDNDDQEDQNIKDAGDEVGLPGQQNEQQRNDGEEDSLLLLREIPSDLNEKTKSSSKARKKKVQGRHHDHENDKNNEEALLSSKKNEEEDNCLPVPLPWIVCCICLLAIQLIALLRYYCSMKDKTKEKMFKRTRDHDQESMS